MKNNDNDSVTQTYLKAVEVERKPDRDLPFQQQSGHDALLASKVVVQIHPSFSLFKTNV